MTENKPRLLDQVRQVIRSKQCSIRKSPNFLKVLQRKSPTFWKQI